MTNRLRNSLIVAALVVAVAAVVAQRQRQVAAPTASVAVAPLSSHVGAGRPRLVDLGAQNCVPCRMMAPVLEDLRREYAGVMDVVFIDVWKDPDAGTPYGIRAIPTQIFFDREGRELFRHEGFIAKEDILAKWKGLGYDFGAVGARR